MKRILKYISFILIIMFLMGSIRNIIKYYDTPFDPYIMEIEEIFEEAFGGKPDGIRDESNLKDTQPIK